MELVNKYIDQTRSSSIGSYEDAILLTLLDNNFEITSKLLLLYVYFTKVVDIRAIKINYKIGDAVLSIFKYAVDVDFDDYKADMACHVKSGEQTQLMINCVDYLSMYRRSFGILNCMLMS